ncbi:MAG: M15 family metallopeptidase [Clostridiaceae bacterium]|nr:M15 family metallopeptidase [Clostridiaceae bacterium]
MSNKKNKNQKNNKLNIIKIIIGSLCIILLVMTIILVSKPELLYRVQGSFLGRNDNHISFKENKYSEINLQGFDLNSQTEWRSEQSLILLNKAHALPEGFVPQMAEYKDSGVQMNVAILDAYAQLSAAVTENTGDKMYVSSVYRSVEEQAELQANDPELALPPGNSEHHTGLAVDVYVFEHAGMNFLESEAGQYVNKNCYDFGFIIRYPKDKEDITGISFEPWHLRYVGLPHSKIIQQKFITFEEYINLLQPNKFYHYDKYLITRQPLNSNIKLPTGLQNIVYSPDNTGHVIVTGQIID